MRATIVCWLTLVAMPLQAAIDYDREQIQQRISPVGQVRVQKETLTTTDNATAEDTKKEVAAPQNSGQATYEHYCVVCHRDGIAGAPKFKDTTDWQSRLATQNIDALTATAIKGLNAMPAKGTCQECTEADIKAAIEYMVPQK